MMFDEGEEGVDFWTEGNGFCEGEAVEERRWGGWKKGG